MSILKTNAIVDITGGNAVTVNGVLLNAGTVSSDDRIINGDFGYWQRGVSFNTFVYGADRWVNVVVGGTGVQSRQSFALGDTLGSNSPTYFLRQNATGQTLATHYVATTQRIEGVRSYAGQTITVLGWARRSSGDGNMSIDADQVFGAGNVLGIGQNTVALTTSWAPFAAVIQVPSVTGKTISITNDYLGINFWISAGSAYNPRTNSLGFQTIGVDLWGIHIKHGIHTPDVVDLYRPRDPATELALCQRYYEVLYVTSAINGSYVNSLTFAVTKRAFPQVTLVSGNLASGTFSATSTGIGQINNSTGASNVLIASDAEI